MSDKHTTIPSGHLRVAPSEELVRDQDDELVCLTVYRKGAREVVRRLAA